MGAWLEILADDVERGDESRRTDSKGKNEFHALPPPAVVARFRLRRPEVGPEFGAGDAKLLFITYCHFRGYSSVPLHVLSEGDVRNSKLSTTFRKLESVTFKKLVESVHAGILFK